MFFTRKPGEYPIHQKKKIYDYMKVVEENNAKGNEDPEAYAEEISALKEQLYWIKYMG